MSATEQLRQAVVAFSRGDLPAARKASEAALRQKPNDPQALQLCGIICCQAGDVAQGAAYLREAMKRGVDTPDIKLNLARALVELGELTEAETLVGEAGPDQPPSLQRMHADILKAQRRHWEAIQAYEQLLSAHPGDFEAWNNLGNARNDAGDASGAVAALQQARSLNPQSATIHTNLGRVLASMSRYEDSCLLFQEAVRLAPNDPSALLEFGQALSRLDQAKEALIPLANAARIDPTRPEIFVAIGLAFAELADLRQAEQSYRIALKVKPGFAPALLNLGLLLEQANRLEELEALIQEAASAGLVGGEIDYLRALSLRRQGKLEDALALASSSVSDAIDPAVRSQFIGQVADRLGEVDVAFAAFEDMNRAMAESPLGHGFDRSAYRFDIEKLAARTTEQWYASWLPAEPLKSTPAPVFLVGFPRSGTTLLDTILMGHPDTHVLEELPILAEVAEAMGSFERTGEIAPQEAAALRALYFDKLAKLSPAPAGKLIIDKNPLSMIRAPFIHRIFPDAKIIFALRHPCDVVLSCFMQNFKVTQAMASFLDLTSGSLLYDRIMAYWEQCRGIFPLDVHEIRYEAMVADTEAEVRPLLDFLGLPWHDEILDHQRTAADRGYIRTPSYAQVLEPVYARARGRWERYRHHLAHVLPVLGPWAHHFGYGDLSPNSDAEEAVEKGG